MSSRDELQTLSRGLQALAFLNENGLTNLSTLARHLEVPRANAYRIINTLIAEGYCTRIPHSRLYQTTPACWRLSKGVKEAELLTSVAIALIERLGSELKWPLTLATPHGSGMLVRMTTDKATPLALARFNAGFLAEMLRTTTGLLYLALERADVAERLIAELVSKTDLDDYSLGRGQLEDLLRIARRDGYLLLTSPRSPEANVGVPILAAGRPIGGLVMRYTRSALSRTAVIDGYVPRLKAAAAEIQRLYGLAAAGMTSLEPAESWDDAAAAKARG